MHEIFEKIRLAIHKHGIRTTEFFKDHDKLRSGEITENQVKGRDGLAPTKVASFLCNHLTRRQSSSRNARFFPSIPRATKERHRERRLGTSQCNHRFARNEGLGETHVVNRCSVQSPDDFTVLESYLISVLNTYDKVSFPVSL